MGLEDVTLWLFASCNSLRVLAYVPQMRKAAADRHGASAVSCTTWSLFLVAHLSTVAYALVNRGDWGLAACFAANALGCLAIIAIARWKRLQRQPMDGCPTFESGPVSASGRDGNDHVRPNRSCCPSA